MKKQNKITLKDVKCPGCGSFYIYTKKSGARVCRKCGGEWIRRGAGWALVNDDMTEQMGA